MAVLLVMVSVVIRMFMVVAAIQGFDALGGINCRLIGQQIFHEFLQPCAVDYDDLGAFCRLYLAHI